jgi:hypothetical protein
MNAGFGLRFDFFAAGLFAAFFPPFLAPFFFAAIGFLLGDVVEATFSLCERTPPTRQN